VCSGLLLPAPHVAADSEGDGEARFSRALKLLKSGSDDPRAVQLFEAAAASGDVGAMYVLGAMYLEGKHVPQNRALGIAYLKLAVVDEDPDLRSTRRKAQAWIWTGEASMNGRELIEVDQQFLRLTKEIRTNLAARMARAASVFTDEAPVEFEPTVRFAGEPVRLRTAPPAGESVPFMPGCGAESLPTCPAKSKSADERRCTGEIFAADSPASADRTKGALLVAPDYPDQARRFGDEGTVLLLAHVDRSGWVCGVAVAVSSGATSLDTAALRAATKWKLLPATRGGMPTESLRPLGVTFRLTGW
jgi:TonB family protein